VIAYVESNFVLELALLQGLHASCEAILRLCEEGSAQLVMPAFCLIEPYETLGRRQAQRKEVKRAVEREFVQLARTSSYTERLSDFGDLTSILIDSAHEEMTRLDAVSSRLLQVADVLAMDTTILAAAARHRTASALSPQDAVVYASILSHLESSSSPPASCFLNADRRDFDDPDIVEKLASRQCKLIPRFDHGHQYLLHSRSSS
jgi:predicted nucleic acid-binding protein